MHRPISKEAFTFFSLPSSLAFLASKLEQQAVKVLAIQVCPILSSQPVLAKQLAHTQTLQQPSLSSHILLLMHSYSLQVGLDLSHHTFCQASQFLALSPWHRHASYLREVDLTTLSSPLNGPQEGRHQAL